MKIYIVLQNKGQPDKKIMKRDKSSVILREIWMYLRWFNTAFKTAGKMIAVGFLVFYSFIITE